MKKFLITTVMAVATILPSASTAYAQAMTANTNQNYNQATASWKLVTGAVCYNIYYKRATDPNWKHSVPCLPNNMWKYTIKALKQNVSYVYSVYALDSSGKEFSWTKTANLITSPQQ